MKKIISVALALALVLSLGVSAFAAIGGKDADGKDITQSPVNGDAQCVSADATGDDLTVTGNVTGDGTHNSVNAAGGGKINVGGTVTGNISWGGDAIYAKDGSTKVVVVGTVTEKAGGSAINASLGAAVEVGKVSEDGKGNGVSASGSNTKVTVNGEVTEGADGSAISAGKGAEVTVKGYVSEHEGGDAINATEGATVIVEKYVNEDGAGNAVSAHEGANVTVKGNVNEKGDGDAIFATGANVTIEGNVTEKGTGSAINVQKATIIVIGNVEESGDGDAITAKSSAMVKVGGNVTGETGCAINTTEGATVIVEGDVTGQIKLYHYLSTSPEVYIGRLDGTIDEGKEANVHYLLGTASDSKYGFGDIALTEGSDIIDPQNPIQGVEKYYLFTSTADPTTLKDKTITLKPNDSNKILTVTGFENADVLYTANEDGTVTFIIGENFKGGMQNLVLILKDKSGPSPVYYIVPLGSVTTASVKLPAGVAEGLIKALDSADHAGITVDSSLVGDGSVKVLKDGKELSAKDFSTYTHADGSIDVIMSNTYLYALGSGSYDFTAVVGGTEIGFSVLVAV